MRTCQPDRNWSGTEPFCQSQFSHICYFPPTFIGIAKTVHESIPSGAHKEKERLTSTYTRGSHLVIAGETALPCMEATKCLQTASLHCV